MCIQEKKNLKPNQSWLSMIGGKRSDVIRGEEGRKGPNTEASCGSLEENGKNLTQTGKGGVIGHRELNTLG